MLRHASPEVPNEAQLRVAGTFQDSESAAFP